MISNEDPPQGSRPRVVIEDNDEARAWLERHLLQAAGYDAEVCGGRQSQPGRQCPLVREGWCRLLDRADAVVCHLPPGEKLDVVRRIRDHYPGIVVVIDPEGEARTDDLSAQLLERNPVQRPEPESELARGIRAALRASPG